MPVYTKGQSSATGRGGSGRSAQGAMERCRTALVSEAVPFPSGYVVLINSKLSSEGGDQRIHLKISGRIAFEPITGKWMTYSKVEQYATVIRPKTNIKNLREGSDYLSPDAWIRKQSTDSGTRQIKTRSPKEKDKT